MIASGVRMSCVHTNVGVWLKGMPSRCLNSTLSASTVVMLEITI